ncbi:PIR protein [Plasmodium vivax]|uniref:VIR protein n=1 Tax=Plasmodium vivax TaxID=5855 RepID=A0A565A3P5_PLAVI|nr:PIR protein [Plasmodium vivax]
MTEDIYDVEKWKKEICYYYFIFYRLFLIIFYPFLERTWKSYEKFDKSVDEDGYKGVYKAQCDVFSGQTQTQKGKYNDFCMKLVRNLGPFSKNPEKERLNSESCQFLNQWVYYMTMKYDIPDNFIKKIFADSNETISAWNKKHVCLYDSYKEKIQEPHKIIKIFNLQIVMDDLVSILKQENHKNSCSSRNFVYECTNTYKRLNRDHCSGENQDPEYLNMCSQLRTFSTSYEYIIRLNPDLKTKIPSLTDDIINDIIRCESKKSMEELTDINPEVQKRDIPIKIDTNAVLGTMVGVSSLFALSYKFTPLGKWFRPRHLRDTLASNNIGKQAEYELFHNGPEDGNISFDQTKYNVAYSPV